MVEETRSNSQFWRSYREKFVVSCPDHTSHEENDLVNQVEFLGSITRMW